MFRLCLLVCAVALFHRSCVEGSALSVLHGQEEVHGDSSPALRAQLEIEKNILANLTKCPSLKQLRPIGSDPKGTTHVVVNSYIRDLRIKKVDDGLFEWTTDLILRQKWEDSRLAYDASQHPDYKFFTMTGCDVKSVWTPDLFFSSPSHGEVNHILAPNSLIWLYPNGTLLYSVRTTVTQTCPQPDYDEKSDLICTMRLASYGYVEDDVSFSWDSDPIQQNSNLYIPHYNLKEITYENEAGASRIGKFSSVTAKLHFAPKG